MQRPKRTTKANDITKESGLLSLFSGTRWRTRLQGMHDLNVSLPGSSRESVLLRIFLLPLCDQLVTKPAGYVKSGVDHLRSLKICARPLPSLWPGYHLSMQFELPDERGICFLLPSGSVIAQPSAWRGHA